MSSKPAPGKDLFDNSTGTPASQIKHGVKDFQNERTIHGQIRPFTLRSSKHWEAVHSAVSAHQGSLARVGAPAHVHDKVREYQTAAKLMNGELYEALHLKQLPAGIRESVMAQLKDNRALHAYNSNSSQRSSQYIKPGNAAHGSALARQTTTDMELDIGQRGFQGTKGGHNYSVNSSQGSNLLFLVTCFLATSDYVSDVSHGNGHNSDKNESQHFHDKGFGKSSKSTVDVAEYLIHLKGVSLLLGCRMMERGYGTAPVWYEQSMENGPPIVVNSLQEMIIEREAVLTANTD
jgi:hypothetical protein